MALHIGAPPEEPIPSGGSRAAGALVTVIGLGVSVAEADVALHSAESIVTTLTKLLKPADEKALPHLYIYLIDTRESGNTKPDKLDAPGNGGAPEILADADITIAPGESLARQITKHLVRLWFGDNAALADVFIEGIAGIALAHTLAGPNVDEADAWVLKRLTAGQPVTILGKQSPGRAGRAPKPGDGAPGQDEFGGLNAAAISFVGYLCSSASPERLKRYLGNFNPDRQDQAAIEAYNHPLAVLEQEWLARVRGHSGSGDTFLAFFRSIAPLLNPYRWKQFEILIYLLLAAAYNIVQPYAIKIFIDRVTHQLRATANIPTGVGPAFVENLLPFLFALLLIYAVNGLVSLRRAYTVAWLNQNVLNSLQIRMYAHLQRLTHRFYNNAKTGDLMARISDDLDNVQSALSQVTNKALYQLFTIVGAVAALLMLTRKSPELAIPILFIIPLFAANYVALRTRNKQASREQRKRVSQAMTAIHQDLQAHALIKAFGMEGRALEAYRGRVVALQKSKLRLALLSAITDASEDMTTAVAQLVIFGVGGYLVLRDHGARLGVGDLSALLVLVKSIFSPIASLSGIGQTMQQATGSMERVSELLQEPVSIEDGPDSVALPPLSRTIRFEGVSFSYDGAQPAMRSISFEVPAHSHIAIVGPSGSGKSTMVNLLMRFWDADSGTILFDDHDIRNVTLASLRNQIGLVFQETFILDTTLRANIAIGRPDATDAEIAAAAKAAQLDTFIEALPAGYNTIPGENGAKLSVGQKQRIAIARVFLRNPPLLILDEATSALDASKEAEVLETLNELAKGRTTISITHRIAQAASADRILVISEGKLAEQGTHDELMRAAGLYRQLWEQSTGMIALATSNAA